MELDRLALEGNETKVRFYTWPAPSCTWGVFVRPEELVKEGALERYSIAHATRPTGGGLLFHGTDLALSVFLPAAHPKLSFESQDNYDMIHALMLEGLAPHLEKRFGLDVPMEHYSMKRGVCHFCQARATRYDLYWAGKKIGGSAERHTKKGLLHQTSLFVEEPDWELMRKVVKNEQEIEEMKSVSAFISLDVALLVEALTLTMKRLILV